MYIRIFHKHVNLLIGVTQKNKMFCVFRKEESKNVNVSVKLKQRLQSNGFLAYYKVSKFCICILYTWSTFQNNTYLNYPYPNIVSWITGTYYRGIKKQHLKHTTHHDYSGYGYGVFKT